MTYDTQPQSQLKNALCFSGASIAVQWYCPPDVGHMLAISAREAAVASAPSAAYMNPYTSEAGPPSVMAVLLAN